MNLVAAGVLLVLLGGACALALRRRARLADECFRAAVLAGCGCAATAALRCLAGEGTPPWLLTPTLPGGPWEMGLDRLSAWFLLLLSIASGVTTIFGVTYMSWERTHRSVAPVHAGWSVLVAAMMAVLVARSAVWFLIAWEIMAVTAYFLMMFESDRADVRRAGLVYLVATHLGTLALVVMFLSWGHSGADFSFSRLAASSASLPLAGAVVLLLSLFGFGVKAGVVPLHFWLPGAHAAAPSHVSALLSGVMLKVGVYGLLRVQSMFGVPPRWWGWGLLGLGVASALHGVLSALGQSDIKRVLAYSSVENIGIVLLGLGLGALGNAYHHPALALAGYAGALLHALNHALFKSLLFVGAGAVVHATGTRELDRMGGLARSMPRTALAFLVGSIAIVGLPPLNGFVSEWTLFRALLEAGRAAGPLRFAVLAAAGLGLVGALALACFARVTGIVFLGRPRDTGVGGGLDAGPGVMLPVAALTLLCAAIGLAPALALGSAIGVAREIAGDVVQGGGPVWDVGPAAMLPVFGGAILLLVTCAWIVRGGFRHRTLARTSTTWGCAYPEAPPRMQYTASSFTAPLLRAMRGVGRGGPARAGGENTGAPGGRSLPGLARPIWGWIQAAALHVRAMQHGRVTSYLRYMMWTVLLLLGFLLVASTGAGR